LAAERRCVQKVYHKRVKYTSLVFVTKYKCFAISHELYMLEFGLMFYTVICMMYSLNIESYKPFARWLIEASLPSVPSPL